MTNGKPGPGQGSMFEENEQGAKEAIELSRRRSIGGAINEKHLGRAATEAFIEADTELVDPTSLEKVLFTASSRRESRQVGGIAINSKEAEAVPGSVDALTRRVTQRTDAARRRKGEVNADRRASKAHKSRVETLRGYLGKRDDVLSGLTIDKEMLEFVSEALRYRHLSRGTDSTMLRRLNFVEGHIFGNILEVAADESGWDQDTRDRARHAMHYMLSASHFQKERLPYWVAMTELARRYTGAKINIFKHKYRIAERDLQRLEESGQTEFGDNI